MNFKIGQSYYFHKKVMIMKNNLAMCNQKVAHPNLQLMFKNMNDIFLYHNYCDMARSHRIMTNNSP